MTRRTKSRAKKAKGATGPKGPAPEVVIVEGPKSQRSTIRRERRLYENFRRVRGKAPMGEANQAFGREKRAEIRSLGTHLSPAGLDWVRVATNPCDTSVGVVSYPDLTTGNVLTPHEREKVDIRPDLTPIPGCVLPTPTSRINPDLNWNLLLFTDPTTLTTWYLVYQGAIGNPTYAAWFKLSIRIRPHIQADMMASRVVAFGSTMDYTGPTLADQGQQVCAQLKPNWMKTLTIAHDAEDAEETVMAWSLNDADAAAPNPQTLFDFVRELMEADRQAVAGHAKVGGYFIHKKNEPTLLFKKHEYHPMEWGATPNKDALWYVNPFQTIYQGTTLDNLTADNTQMGYCSPYAWNTSVYWAEGLSIQASYALKIYCYMEGQITPSSAFRYYGEPSPDSDRNAEEVYQAIATHMPSAYPSAANAFGWLKRAFDWVGGAVKKGVGFLKPFKPVLDAVIPGAGQVVDYAGNIADTVWQPKANVYRSQVMPSDRRTREIFHM